MVRNSINRMFMHGHWWTNDPDCMLLRQSLSFTSDEIRGIATIKALSGGSFIISDDLDTISNERFRIALQLMPPTNIPAEALDLLEREMPELLRLQLSSSYSRQEMKSPRTLRSKSNSFIYSKPGIGINTGISRSNSGDDSHNRELFSYNIEDSPRSDVHPINDEDLNFDFALSNMKHLKKSYIFKAEEELDCIINSEKIAMKRLKKENELKESDLLGKWTIFTVCNWSNSVKSHYVKLSMVFGEAFVSQLNSQKNFHNYVRKLHKKKIQRTEEIESLKSNNSNEMDFSVDSNISNSNSKYQEETEQIFFLTYQFNFWLEKFSSRLVSFQEDWEMGFLDIPKHSAHIYSVGVLVNSPFPQYIGSNLHFSCGLEIKRFFMIDTPPISKIALEQSAFVTITNSTGTFSSNSLLSENGVKNVPIIKTAQIQFEQGSLRDTNWNGFIWIFLPMNWENNNLRVELLEYNVSFFGSAFVHIDDPTDTEPTIRTPRGYHPLRGRDPYRKKSADKTHTNQVNVASYIDQPECRVKGAVFQIPVSSSKYYSTPSNMLSDSLKSRSMDESVEQDIGFEETLTISWVYDMIPESEFDDELILD